MVRISDTFHPANGMPVAPVESITLAVYREEAGGTPLWQETQNVTVDAEGHYTALMGSTLNEGIPLDLFRSAEPRWLGVQFNRPGETEQPRRRLASVPYALKASDAETLGGRPASAYLLDPNVVGNGSGNSAGSTPAALPDAKSLKPRQTTSGTMNYLPYFLDNSSDLGNSTVYQNGINVGVGTTAPARKLDLVDASSVFQMRLSTGSNEGGLGADGNGFFRVVGALGGGFGTGSASQGTFNEVMRIINGRVGIGTTAPARKLDLVDATSVFQMRFSTGSNEGGWGADGNGFFRVVGTLGGALGTGSASQGTFNEVMRIINGNVGIGTTAPSAPLEVAGNLKISGTGHSLVFPDGTQQTTAATSGGLSGGGRTNYLPLWTGSSTLGYSALYQLNGNVGLGTTAPSAPLEVAGNLKISGTGHSLTFPDGTQQTTAATSGLSGGTANYIPLWTGSSSLSNSVISQSSGTVSIGTTTQAATLNVTGSIQLQGTTILETPSGTCSFGNNLSVGQSALPANTQGTSNTAVGTGALASNVGDCANPTDASFNTAIGSNALASNTTGSNNIAIGSNAGFSITTGTNNIYIGYQGSSATESSTIRIGDPAKQTEFFAAGIATNPISPTNAVAVQVDTTTGQLGVMMSSRRYKEDIEDMGDASRGLMRLRPVTFHYKKPFADSTRPIQYGLIAEEVAEVYPDLVAHSADGQIETVKYQVLDSMLLNEVQRQQRQIDALTEENRRLKERLAKLETAMAKVSSLTDLQ